MKVQIVSVVLLAVFSVAFGASFFSEKDDAKKAVNEKFNEVEELIHIINDRLHNEKEKKDEQSFNQAVKVLNTKKAEASKQLNEIATEVTKVAIAKEKPISSIECIANTFKNGVKLIAETGEINSKKINEVLNIRKEIITFLEVQKNLIQGALNSIKVETLKKIDEAKTGFGALKAEALKKAETASKQLHEIEVNIQKSSLFELYSTLRKEIDKSFKDVVDNLKKQFQKC